MYFYWFLGGERERERDVRTHTHTHIHTFAFHMCPDLDRTPNLLVNGMMLKPTEPICQDVALNFKKNLSGGVAN